MPSLQNQLSQSTKMVVHLQQSNADLMDKVQGLEQQLAWFKRQIFGQKPEKFIVADNPYQMTIADVLGDLPYLHYPATMMISKPSPISVGGLKNQSLKAALMTAAYALIKQSPSKR